MDHKKLVSIITPSYNHENYIGDCIESVLNQTYPYWEQIIIDDGSTDKTSDLVADYDDNRIIHIKQKNLGIYNLKKTYNKALNISRGKYIAILEGDDYWPDYKLEEQIKIFQNTKVILGWGNAQVVNDNNEVEGMVHKSKSFTTISSTYKTLDKLFLRNFIPACTVICQKKALLDIGGFQQPINSPFVDYSTWLQLSKLGCFYYEDRIMGYWRRHKGQVSSENAFEMINSGMDYSIKLFNEMSTEEKKLLTINVQDIFKSRNKILADYNFVLGRECLNKKNWEESRKFFKLSLKGSNTVKFYSLIGIICSYFKIDFDKLVSTLN